MILAQYGRTRLAALAHARNFFWQNFFLTEMKYFFNRFIENPKLDALLPYKFMSYKFLNLRTCPIPDIEKKTLGAYMIFYMAILRV